MQKPRYYIKPLQASGRRLPVVGFVTWYLLLDKFHVPEWLIGIFFFCCAIVLLLFFWDISKFNEKEVDIQKLLRNIYEADEQQKKI